MADPASELLSRRTFLLDLSMVQILDQLDPDPQGASFLVPATLDNVLRERPTANLARLLTAATLPRNATPVEREHLVITLADLKVAIDAYGRLAERGVVTVIPDEEVSDPSLRQLVTLVTPTVPDGPAVQLDDGSSITPRGLVKRHLGTLLSHAKRTGNAMLSRGRLLTSRINARFPVVNLPDGLAAVREKKLAFSKRLGVQTERAKDALWVMGGGLVVAGFVVTGGAAVPIGIAGGVLWAIDP